MSNQQVPEKVVRILMRDIFTNKLKPGTKLPPAKEISKEINVDLSSLRIALKQLEAMNVLYIKQGDGIYVRDYLKHAGIDFIRLLFTQDETNDNDKEWVVDECLIDEVWEYWSMFFPEMLKLAATRFSLRDMKKLRNLFDEEFKNIKDRKKVIELEEQQQDLVAEVCNNTIISLSSNSYRPMRRRIIEIFINNISEEDLQNFIETKKSLLKDFAKGTIKDANDAADKYRALLSLHRQMVRQMMLQNDNNLPAAHD